MSNDWQWAFTWALLFAILAAVSDGFLVFLWSINVVFWGVMTVIFLLQDRDGARR